MIASATKREFLLRCAWRGSVVLSAPWLGACEPTPTTAPRAATGLDIDWHRQDLLQNQLEPWLKVLTQLPGGHFAADVDRRWKPVAKPSNDLTLQSRLVYTMIVGHAFTQDARMLEAAKSGADFLLEKFRDPVHGGFFTRVAANGEVVAAHKNSYAHAFALLALAHMARVTREPKYAVAALLGWRDVRRKLLDADGGLRAEAPRDFAANAGGRSQNPVMHMFEALLALARATQDPAALQGATELGNFVIGKLLQDQGARGACVPEFYDERWQPVVSREKGGYIDLGHQFEWSHLLSASEDLGLPAGFAAAGARILQYALQVGYDEIDGGAFNQAYADGSVNKEKYFWQQAECLHALLIAAQREGRPELWRRYEQTVALVKNEFIDKDNGTWRMATKRLCDSGRCGDVQPDPYHMVSMHLAALLPVPRKR